jgi:hypothetical protein
VVNRAELFFMRVDQLLIGFLLTQACLTPTPCFAKKRLDVVENKGLAMENAEKRACIVLP